MPVEFDFDADGVIDGLRQVEREYDSILFEVMDAALDMVVDEAKANHDYQDRTGTLTNSIGKGEIRRTAGGRDVVGVVSAGAPYALAIEHGARPHVIRPKHRRALRWPVEGGFGFATEVYHPGNRPYRFLSNALERVLPDIEAEFEAAVSLAFHRAGF